MTRRLTINSRSEMGLPPEPVPEPDSPPPVWTPAKSDFWRKPSKWQICMPRLRMTAKVILSIVFFIIVVKVLQEKPPEKIPPPPPTLNELMDQLKEQNAREYWMWKDFRQYVKSTSQDKSQHANVWKQTRWSNKGHCASEVLYGRQSRLQTKFSKSRSL